MTHAKAIDAVAIISTGASILGWLGPILGIIATSMSIAWLSVQFYIFIRDKKWKRPL